AHRDAHSFPTRRSSDLRLSADGRRVVFGREHELWIVEVETDESRRLTFDAAGTTVNGLAEYIAQEEMGRGSGFWISPDGARVARSEEHTSELQSRFDLV